MKVKEIKTKPCQLKNIFNMIDNIQYIYQMIIKIKVN